ncbi:MAG: discoidin domain-containing protein [Nitrososphaeraceae archaeon]
MNSVLIKSLYQNKKYVLLSSLLVMIFVTALESTILLSVNGESQAKSDSPVDINALDGDNNSTQNSDVPIAKMVYNSKSYEMSPFVVVENEELKRLNFPQLPDDSEPMVQISSDENITFSFITKPREMNAFFVDYDADTTEMTPLNRVGKNQFSFADVYGPNTLELRVIFPDGKYVTYTCLIEVKKPEVKEVDLSTDNNNIMNANDDSYGNLQSNDANSSNFDQTSPTEEHVLNQYGNMVDLGNEQHEELNLPDIHQEPTNYCEYNEIPIADVQTDINVNTSDVSSNNSISKPRWTALDLGQQQNVCGIKVTFKNVDNKIKFFTLEFSNDGKKYTPAEYYSSTGTNSPSEIYDLKEGPVKARFIKLTELDITDSIEWISDLIVLGNNEL